MTGDVIKSFLVGLGFDVSDSDLKKFNKAIESASLRVTALYASITAAAVGIFYGISKISEGFEQMGYEFRLISPAITKVMQLRQHLLATYRTAGVDIQKVVQESVLFNFSLAKTKQVLDVLYKSVGARFIPLLTKQMDIFRLKILQNMPKIQNVMEKFVKILFKAFEAAAILGGRAWSILERLWDFFAKLDQATDGWSTKIIGAIALWKLLNLSFLATPLGMILTGLLSLLALWDDFKTFQEGGESFLNWGKIIPVIQNIVQALQPFWDILKNIFTFIGYISQAIGQLFSGDLKGLLSSLDSAGQVILDLLENVLGILKTVLDGFAGLAGGAINGVINKVSDFFGSVGKGGASQNNSAQPTALGQAMNPQPLVGAGGANQSVNQETNITVQGSADAGATGQAVAGQQSRVNFDMTRNLRGAAR